MIYRYSALLSIFLLIQCANPKTESFSSATRSGSQPTSFSHLPKGLNESSGLEVYDQKIFSMNDHGGKPELFVMDNSGKELHKIEIKNVKSKDWESLALNSTEFFIGDFGNNAGDRDDLAIYRFPLAELGKDKVEARAIHFQYADQKELVSEKRKSRFDGESLIALDDEVVFFSKDWVENSTEVYHIPLNSSEEILKISPTEKLQIGALITGADYDAKNKRLVLCGYDGEGHNSLWIFEGATSQKFLTTDFKKIDLSDIDGAQVEGVTFLDENTVLFSTEKTKKYKPQLWTISIK